MKKIIFILLISLVGKISFGQGFTADTTVYLKEVQKLFATVNKGDAKKFIEEFHPIWSSDKFKEEMRQLVYATSNKIQQKRMGAFELKDYLIAVMNAVRSDQSLSSFQAWHDVIHQVADKKNKRTFADYLKGSAELFSDNIIFRSASTTWQSSSKDYEFDFDRVPIIRFSGLDLKCYSKGDSSIIYGTKGTYYPLTGQWKGTGGKVTWERAKIESNKVFGLISDYKIGMKSAGFSADSVELYSPYFIAPIKGRIVDKARTQSSKRDAIYPQFTSYSKRLVIRDIFPGVDYDGGFSLEGPNLIGRGEPAELAKVKFYRDNKLFAVASALTFTINEEKITSQKVRPTIYLLKDSITHPGVNFTYQNKDKSITFIRENEGVGASPFFNTYHELDMYFESITWKQDEPYMKLGALFGNTDNSALFESSSFFDKSRYDAMTSSDGNPLVILQNIEQELDTNVFEIQLFARGMRAMKEDILEIAYHLSNSGFIFYDPETDLITVKPRLKNYIKQRVKKQDYDAIQIDSRAQKEYNALLDLSNLDLQVNGVKRVNLSAAQFTMIYPDNQELIIQKNRNMLFSGIINAGRTEYFGEDFYFEYDEFLIDMPACDSVRMRPIPNKEQTNPRRLLSKIEDVTGIIYIDDPKNKSGNDEKMHQYPILKTDKETYVYYNDRAIQNGAYDKEKFRFIIEPFEMDSLDNYLDEALRLDGTLISSGIFPDLKESLAIQEDYSLGFIKKSPPNGYEIYGRKANYTNDVALSHEGLKGNGEISFLTSFAKASDMTFLPESILAKAEEYVNKGQTSGPEVPSVKGENVKIDYKPYVDILIASSIKKELEFFDEEVGLSGDLTLTPEGMTGAGTMAFNKAELLAERFDYKYRGIDADTSAFSLINTEGKGFSFKTENVSSHIDFDKRMGEFKSNGDNDVIEFPENQYVCLMEEFTWFMDEDNLELTSTATSDTKIDSELDIDEPNFFSVHPDQDSLAFRSGKARYDLTTKQIDCKEVNYIQVADARISPSDGNVIVKKNAVMETLKDASILANYITKHHQMYKATVNISSKLKYVGTGYYKYIDENKREQEIFFANIQPDTTFSTYAKGTILEKDKFRLSPNFEYFGEMEMFASVKELTFDGQTRISHNCSQLPKNWMKFKAAIDPQEIFIPVGGELTDQFGNALGAGVTLNTDSIGIYPTFLSVKTAPTHVDILAANGYLYFNKATREYQISNKEKLRENSLPGNFVSINSETCKIQGEGKMNLGANLGQVEIVPYGTMKYSNERKIINTRSSIPINFPFNESALEKMARHLAEFEGLMPVDFSQSSYEKALREILGLEEGDRVISDLNIKGVIKKMPDELQKSLFLADVRLVWDKLNNSYRSVGQIGVGNILKKQIYKYVGGIVEVKKGRNGDVMTVYLELDDDNFYFFQYRKGLMSVYSTNDSFNKEIQDMKSDKKKVKGKKGAEDFTYFVTSKSKALQFVNSIE